MIFHVYAILVRGEEDLESAQKTMLLTKQYNFKDFDLAYAYEVMARAHSASENNDECNSWFNKAKEAGELIDSVEDKKIFEGDLKAGPRFGCSL